MVENRSIKSEIAIPVIVWMVFDPWPLAKVLEGCIGTDKNTQAEQFFFSLFMSMRQLLFPLAHKHIWLSNSINNISIYTWIFAWSFLEK